MVGWLMVVCLKSGGELELKMQKGAGKPRKRKGRRTGRSKGGL